ncbi:MAG: S41 family peptidase [Chloroflexota bacterium]
MSRTLVERMEVGHREVRGAPPDHPKLVAGWRRMLPLLVLLLASGCASNSMTPTGSLPAPTQPAPDASADLTPTRPLATVTASDAWAKDLDFLDRQVREIHPDPWMNTPEAEWAARVTELKASIPSMSRRDAVVAVTELVALLDAHTGLFPEENGFEFYALKTYEFADGTYVVAAEDPTLVSSRLDSIGGMPIEAVHAALTPLVNHDNDSSLRWLRDWYLSVAEYLQAKGIVAELDHPAFQLTKPDGTKVSVDPRRAALEDAFEGLPIIGGIAGDSLEFVRRGVAEEIWWRVEPDAKAFLLTYSNIGAPTAAALAAMDEALDSGAADRVIFDMRLSGGGNFQTATPIIDAFTSDPRINRTGGLTVLISRENASASNALAATLDLSTKALLIGEPTPTGPNTIGGDRVVTLPNSGIKVHLPEYRILSQVFDDDRTAVTPDVAIDLTAADYFAGIDRVLQAALAGAAD